MAVSVQIKDNLAFVPRGETVDETLIINRYSEVIFAPLMRSIALAIEHGHAHVRIEHFITALFIDENSRKRLSDLGYSDDDTHVKVSRFTQFARPELGIVDSTVSGFRPSNLLRAWMDAAQREAEKRERELHTITVDDFVAAVRDGIDLPTPELRAVQDVLTRYKDSPVPTFSHVVLQRFDHVDEQAEERRQQVRGDIAATRYDITVVGGDVAKVSSKVDNLMGAVERVELNVHGVAGDAAKIREEARQHHRTSNEAFESLSKQTLAIAANTVSTKADTTLLIAQLPLEMRLSGFLLAVSLLGVAAFGVCAGLFIRMQLGPL